MTDAHHKPRFHPGLWLTVFSVLLFSALIALGFWQLQRLAWKEALIADLQARQSADALIGLPDTAALTPALEFRRIAVTGRFATQPEFRFPGRSHQGVQGLHIALPFLLPDGRAIIVNRGWVPQSQALPDDRTFSLPTDTIRIEGIVRRDGWTGSSQFRPDNDAAGNNWFYYDTRAMAANVKEAPLVQGFYLVAVRSSDSESDLPIPVGVEVALTNNHLVYAITWFTLALGLVVIYFLRGIRPKEPDDAKDNGKS
ncbi:SURF1 family protein [Limibacillus halophilus]|uniref:SURF1-like protein n=1 Tax=Limibacillus halophilus TaxID=1579333 RepID=A0A839T068_9PROT|nr:SURF1 family protein [Limibacillus halophilus]MBB3066705.1 surfeit locus 1 family protein [Limibacillus halophilus]